MDDTVYLNEVVSMAKLQDLRPPSKQVRTIAFTFEQSP